MQFLTKNNVPAGASYAGSAMEYQPIPEPGSDEFKSRIKTSYQKYVNSKAPNIENERIRPPEQEFFDWLLEDKELIHETDKAIREAGFEW